MNRPASDAPRIEWWRYAAWLEAELAAAREREKMLEVRLAAAVAARDSSVRLAARDVAEARERERNANTRLHSLRWLLGLETHEGEEPMTEAEAILNLQALRRAALGVAGEQA